MCQIAAEQNDVGGSLWMKTLTWNLFPLSSGFQPLGDFTAPSAKISSNCSSKMTSGLSLGLNKSTLKSQNTYLVPHLRLVVTQIPSA